MDASRRDFLKAGCLGLMSVLLVGAPGCSQSAASSPKASSSSSQSPSATPESAADIDAREETTDRAAFAGSAAVVYFSATGNTASVAERVAQTTGCTLMEIVPQEPYAPADLDYNSDCRANAEQSDGAARPAIATPAPDATNADVVYLGYPIWWGRAPRIVLTWLESQDLAGKTVVPFCTSGSSGIGGSISEIETAAAGATLEDGMRFSLGTIQQEIDSWIASMADTTRRE